MTGDQIRQAFLDFFESKGHTPMPSASLVPAGDPTLLFTSAGMVPFKPFFMGEATPPSKRLTSSQKSFRTTDIDEVGDHKHLTFFEMLGNFSIGDYFKKDAIAFCWEFVTEHFTLQPDRLYATIYLDDEEAFHHWRDDIGLPEERIYRYGDKDNWWGPAGKEGPCGPCSEIHYDNGEEYACGDPECHPNHECERFVELWNLVFMQFYQDSEGNRTLLPAPSIDTGLGLEWAAAILQGKHNLYETDLFWPIVQKACELSSKTYGVDRETDYAIRVVTEHSRAAAFLIADGVVPGNEGRGYVLRRVIRRAIRYGRRVGLDKPFLTQVVDSAITRFQAAYPELSTNHDFIMRVVGLEEERFGLSLQNGLHFLDGFFSEIRRVEADLGRIATDPESYVVVNDVPFVLRPHTSIARWEPASDFEMSGALLARQLATQRFTLDERAAFKQLDPLSKYREVTTRVASTRRTIEGLRRRLPGDVVFILSSTYGFPAEETEAIAKEKGTPAIDWEGFRAAEESHRDGSRAAHAFTGAMEMLPTYENLGVDRVQFVGYQQLQQESVVTALLVDDAPVGHATKGQKVEVVLRDTPFYAEGGGQVGDAGSITGPNGKVRVEDTQSPVAGLIVHRGVVEEGDVSLGDPVEATVDASRRLDTTRNHSGTHLLHAALRQVLGLHVRQAGSLVAPDRLRFDYSHVSPLSREELLEIQGLANTKVRDNLSVSTRESTLTQAVNDGALAFFGDRYGETVRVVEMSDGDSFSVEVCGGTHVAATGQVGTLFVVGESSIGGGMRRVEAVTGRSAEELFVQRTTTLESLSRKLETPVVDLEQRMDSFIEDADRLRKRLAILERQSLRREAQELLSSAADVDGVKVLSARTSATSTESMREMGDWLKEKLSSAVVVLAALEDGRPSLVAMVTPDLVARGLHAGNIARDTAKVMEGGGGGRPEMAQAGGKRADKLEEALSKVPNLVRQSLT